MTAKKDDQQKKENTQPRIEALEAKWKRALADYQNLEKRIEKEKHDFIRFASAHLISQLVNVLDDLERAQSHNHDTGLKLIYDKLKDILKAEGLEEMKVSGQPFNPETMEAIERIAGKPNQVMGVVTKGYTLNSKVLRPAKVKVGNAASNRNPDPATAGEGSQKNTGGTI